jgi:hypothetical protein
VRGVSRVRCINDVSTYVCCLGAGVRRCHSRRHLVLLHVGLTLLYVVRCGRRYEEVVYLLRKRIANKNFRVVYLAATLIETLIKNCGTRLQEALATDKVMDELRNVIKRTEELRGRDALEARAKVLDLIQQWGEEFLTRRTPATEIFVRTYHELRLRGAAPVTRCFGARGCEVACACVRACVRVSVCLCVCTCTCVVHTCVQAFDSTVHSWTRPARPSSRRPPLCRHLHPLHLHRVQRQQRRRARRVRRGPSPRPAASRGSSRRCRTRRSC